MVVTKDSKNSDKNKIQEDKKKELYISKLLKLIRKFKLSLSYERVLKSIKWCSSPEKLNDNGVWQMIPKSYNHKESQVLSTQVLRIMRL